MSYSNKMKKNKVTFRFDDAMLQMIHEIKDSENIPDISETIRYCIETEYKAVKGGEA